MGRVQRSCEHNPESICRSAQFCSLLALQRDVCIHQCFRMLLELLTVRSSFTLGRKYPSDTLCHPLPWLKICSVAHL